MTTSHSCNAVITSLNYNAVIIFNNFNAVTKLNMTADIFSFNASSKAGVNAGDYDIKNIFTKWSPSVFKHNVLIQLEKKGEIQTMNSNITFQFLIIVIKSYSWNAETNSMLRQEIKQCCANSMVDTSPKVDCHFNCSRWQNGSGFQITQFWFKNSLHFARENDTLLWWWAGKMQKNIEQQKKRKHW